MDHGTGKNTNHVEEMSKSGFEDDEVLIKLIVGVVKHVTIDELGPPVDYRGSNRFLFNHYTSILVLVATELQYTNTMQKCDCWLRNGGWCVMATHTHIHSTTYYTLLKEKRKKKNKRNFVTITENYTKYKNSFVERRGVINIMLI
jgi:hypothetical protein